MARIGRAFPQNRFVRVTRYPSIALSANTLHVTEHIVSVNHIATTSTASALHIVDHIVAVLAAGDIAIATTPYVVVLQPASTDPYNPTFTVPLSTTPLLHAALLDIDPDTQPVSNLTGATVTFSLYDLGGAVIFTRSATLTSIPLGKVTYQVQAGDSADEGTFLGKFHVTYASSLVQDFPDDRYMNVFVA